MRYIAIVFSVIFLASCGGEDNQESCDVFCLKEIALANCCDCLVEKECLISPEADQCVSTLLEGDLITFNIGCADDNDRCGTQCDYLLTRKDGLGLFE